ncbi:MAG: hypothetical protein A3F40_01400 [Chlamydiae bacterium RIFCSPHIGHO2_12_FULL_27_8]|nr:MAG: hypothetical protein A3F40_01400 [Chlamydiae bacterium RIFCSPHIGHO2_12_FULL_27_8]OGN65522.1 MAG: hypothetical protein A2888_00575 [Chlamydiae bacterium RIFCSPLOWO2_01_FULL_28_7]
MIKKIILFIILFQGSGFAYKSSDLLYLGSGINNIFRPNSTSEEFRIEYKSHISWWRFRPFGGISVTTNKQTFIYPGISLEILDKSPIALAINFAPGYYFKGDGKDLGFPLEFRSGIELAVLKKFTRLGINFSHTSNASLSKKNPGLETLVFFIAIPIKYY